MNIRHMGHKLKLVREEICAKWLWEQKSKVEEEVKKSNYCFHFHIV